MPSTTRSRCVHTTLAWLGVLRVHPKRPSCARRRVRPPPPESSLNDNLELTALFSPSFFFYFIIYIFCLADLRPQSQSQLYCLNSCAPVSHPPSTSHPSVVPQRLNSNAHPRGAIVLVLQAPHLVCRLPNSDSLHHPHSKLHTLPVYLHLATIAVLEQHALSHRACYPPRRAACQGLCLTPCLPHHVLAGLAHMWAPPSVPLHALQCTCRHQRCQYLRMWAYKLTLSAIQHMYIAI